MHLNELDHAFTDGQMILKSSRPPGKTIQLATKVCTHLQANHEPNLISFADYFILYIFK